MKIYEHNPVLIIRLQIARQGEQVEYLSLQETTAEEVETIVKELIIKQNLSPFAKGKRTAVNIRPFVGAKAGKQKSISFIGLSPKQTLDLIINYINTKQ